MEKRPVAVFDIDGTVFRSSLLIELVEELIARDIFPKTAQKTYAHEEEEWVNRKGGYDAYINKVIQVFRTHSKGLVYGEIADIAGEIIEAKKDRVYRYTRDLIAELKAKGYFLLAVSRSPKFIVDGFAYEMGFDKSYGIFYATGPTDRFTGEIEDEFLIMNKSAVLARAIDKDNLSLIGSVGVGDTESDISMLDMVETPIAFNPNRLLYRHAKQRNWKVVVERKDVIYDV
ncbi:HAD-IB family hydrolase [Patescibacteria group bacterium]|nr:HAD-IB family hydrolase [Patescibacteria group bacterium]MBU1755328.1 HAD-IB family hydrolase [Patescibacteria group bacterium]